MAYPETTLFTLDGRPVTLVALLTPVAILAATWAITRLLAGVFHRLEARDTKGHGFAWYGLSQVLRYGIIVAGVLAAASAAGIDLTSLSVFAGALGVGVGLGLQDIVKNFVNGIILLFDGSMEVGDYVELEDGTRGTVTAIGPRATTIRTGDNVDILIPNSALLAGRLTNWTRNDKARRIRISFEVAEDVDKDKVREAGIEAARAVPLTRPESADFRTQVWLTGYGEDSLKFELAVWPTLEAVKRPSSMTAAYRWAIDDALRRHNIPLPDTKRMISLAPGEPHPPRRPRTPVATSTNDAAADAVRAQDDAGAVVTAPGKSV
jgi:small-conductance mechanosensitive channel